MAMNNSISVVIPLYNREKLITDTLLSIERQTLWPSEVIIVDDQCTDSSVSVVESFRRNSDLNVVIIKNVFKKGMSGALNCGIKAASGGFIAMQDSDDLWMPTHLQMLYEALCRYPESSIAFSAIEVFGSAKDTQQKNDDFRVSVKRCLDNAFDKDSNGLWVSNGNLLYSLLRYGFPFRCPASLVRREFFHTHDLSFDTALTYTLDSQFMTIASYFTSFLYVDVIGFKLRRHAENDGDIGYGDKISQNYDRRVDKLKDFFSSHKISSKEKSALHHRLWCLQVHVADREAVGKDFMAKAKSAFKLICKVPTWSSMKSVVKLMLGMNII